MNNPFRPACDKQDGDFIKKISMEGCCIFYGSFSFLIL